MPHLVRATIFDGVAVASTGSQTSGVVSLQHVSTLESIVLKASSVLGAADVKLEYSTSPDNASFDSFDDNADITSSQATDKPNNTEGYNAFPHPAPLNNFIKWKVTGVGANPADTLVSAYAMLQED
jgi:hypothetical protein